MSLGNHYYRTSLLSLFIEDKVKKKRAHSDLLICLLKIPKLSLQLGAWDEQQEQKLFKRN